MRLVGSDGRAYQLRTETTIGWAEDNTIVVDDETASGHHAAIRTEGRAFILHDLDSTNGTFLNDIVITEPRILKPGDRILIGETEFRLEERARSRSGGTVSLRRVERPLEQPPEQSIKRPLERPVVPPPLSPLERPPMTGSEPAMPQQVIIVEPRDRIKQGDDVVAILGVVFGGVALLLVAAGFIGSFFGVGVICLGLSLLFGVTGAALSALRLKLPSRSLALIGLILSLVSVVFTVCIGCLLTAAGLSVLGALLEYL
jgi:hypothetical protein